MDWISRWNNNQIGWHKQDFNSRMIKYLPELQLQAGDTIFVPLCGKSLDMIYLTKQGFKVVGVELSEMAVCDFFTENNISYHTQQDGNFTVYISDNITIYQGDIFNINTRHLQHISAIYDRASLVALNPQLRSEYAKLFNGIIACGVRYLLLTLDYDQEAIDGPPFAVNKAEITTLFNQWNIQLLESVNDIDNEVKFKSSGLQLLNKDTYILRKL
jgi:thiopurine S-methyltransferase